MEKVIGCLFVIVVVIIVIVALIDMYQQEFMIGVSAIAALLLLRSARKTHLEAFPYRCHNSSGCRRRVEKERTLCRRCAKRFRFCKERRCTNIVPVSAKIRYCTEHQRCHTCEAPECCHQTMRRSGLCLWHDPRTKDAVCRERGCERTPNAPGGSCLWHDPRTKGTCCSMLGCVNAPTHGEQCCTHVPWHTCHEPGCTQKTPRDVALCPWHNPETAPLRCRTLYCPRTPNTPGGFCLWHDPETKNGCCREVGCTAHPEKERDGWCRAHDSLACKNPECPNRTQNTWCNDCYNRFACSVPGCSEPKASGGDYCEDHTCSRHDGRVVYSNGLCWYHWVDEYDDDYDG